jgi:hypothetical protein
MKQLAGQGSQWVCEDQTCPIQTRTPPTGKKIYIKARGQEKESLQTNSAGGCRNDFESGAMILLR